MPFLVTIKNEKRLVNTLPYSTKESKQARSYGQGWCKVGKKLSLFAPILRKVENKLNTTISRYFYLYSVTLHKIKSKYA